MFIFLSSACPCIPCDDVLDTSIIITLSMTVSILGYLIPLSLFIFATAIFLAKNPVYGVLSFVVVVAHIVFLLIALNLEFLAYILAIVYIGAIVVLFLFVIMMFYLKQGTQRLSLIRGSFEYWFLGFTVTTVFSAYYFIDIPEYNDYAYLISEKPFAHMLAYLLFNDMALFTVAAAFLMFVGILGAIILTIKDPLNTRISPSKVRFLIRDVIEKKQ